MYKRVGGIIASLAHGTYELLLLIGDQLSNFVFTSSQFLFVIREFTHNELLFTSMKFELFDDLSMDII